MATTAVFTTPLRWGSRSAIDLPYRIASVVYRRVSSVFQATREANQSECYDQPASDVLCGPINSGEALPTLGIVSGAKKLQLIGGSVEELIGRKGCSARRRSVRYEARPHPTRCRGAVHTARDNTALAYRQHLLPSCRNGYRHLLGVASPRDIVRAGLVQVLEGHRVFHPLMVEDNLLIGTYARSPRGDRSKLGEIYALFPELAERRHQQASRLSGGQQQILAVAQGIIAEPKLLMRDEPSGGLAPLVIDRILDVASSLARRGVAVLLVEQLVEKALAHADRCYLMSTGHIVHEGLAKDLAGSDVLHSAYLGGAV
jgi:ABC-type branched-subunit amino acid transport system ATPase component